MTKKMTVPQLWNELDELDNAYDSGKLTEQQKEENRNRFFEIHDILYDMQE